MQPCTEYPVVVYQWRGKRHTAERLGKVAGSLSDVLATFKASHIKVHSVETVENVWHDKFYKVVASK